ncbi:FHA domain-containing protein [Agromyces sp. G08B096]|uniref:FHA domain-containing protein n=1 Tax=Agromyces sp. G08B096 TaxID=3156399 RepID=A0AAU7WBJ9_9MICO
MTVYVPDPTGKWVAVVRAGRVLAGQADVFGQPEYWEAVATTDPVATVLGLVTRAGLADAPPFALAVPAGDGEVRIVVRGGFRVRCGDEVVSGARVSTWTERIVAADGLEILAPFARTGGTHAWPAEEAVVAASAVRLGEALASAGDADASAEASTSGVVAPATDAVPLGDAGTGTGVAPADGRPADEAAADETATDEATVVQAPSGPPAPPAPASPPAPRVASEATVIPEQTIAPADEPVVDDEVEDRTIVVPRPTALTASGPDDAEDGTIALDAIQRLKRERARGGDRAAGEAAAPAPSLRLALPGETSEPLTGEIVLGRSPGVGRTVGGRLPRLVTIGAGDPDISRSHVKVGLHGGTVVVTDLNSRNGTTVIQPGRAPVRLRAGEETPVLVGTVIDLGGGWAVTVEGD